MKTFLQYTAEDLYQKHQDHLSQVAVVFPNNRAKIFFVEHLYNMAGKPIWTPQFTQINHLFTQHSDLTVGDPILLNSILYSVYQKITHSEEGFDDFYHWGSIMLNDFDNVDKNCVDASQLFRNISEQGNYADTFEHLSEEQIHIIRLFFDKFTTGQTDLKKKFIHIWNQLYQIYTEFRDKLQSEHLAYEGMLNRSVIEKFDQEGIKRFDAELYAFVGFNALNVCEQKLFKKLHQAGKAVFYWDYDSYYLDNPQHEAGNFLRDNLQQFPNELDKSCFDVFQKTPKKIHFIASPSENAQVHYAGKWLKETTTEYPAEETAIVLCNEKLLLPMLHRIPDEITDLNITMGYPMIQTPVYNLIRQLVLLHTDGYHAGTFRSKFILPVLQNNYIRPLSAAVRKLEAYILESNRFNLSVEDFDQNDEVLSLLFKVIEKPIDLGKMLMDIIQLLAKAENQAEEDSHGTFEYVAKDNQEIFQPMYQESLFQCYTTISHLNDLLKKNISEINLHTYRKLIQKVLNLSIPFSGEPLRGVQIMGLLETRNLDFKNVLLLSTNEGILPKGASDISFIPYNLRRAFHMTGPDHQDAISAYYFFRLIQRAENITLVYNQTNIGLNKGEKSRFMLQLEMESGIEIQQSVLTADIGPRENKVIEISKNDTILKNMPKVLSPSGINSYLTCSLNYYFHYLLHLREEEEIMEEVDAATFGNMFHHGAEYLYTGILLKKNNYPYLHEDIVKTIEAKDKSAEQAQETDKHLPLNDLLKKDDFSGNITQSDLEHLPHEQYIENIVDYFFQKDFFKTTDKKGSSASRKTAIKYNGEQLIQRKLLIDFLKSLLKIDKSHTPFKIIGLEHKILEKTGFMVNGEEVCIRGFIDRIDQKDHVIRILDYKTGGKPIEPKSIEKVFDTTEKSRAKYILQAFLYADIIQKNLSKEEVASGIVVKPELLYIHLAKKEDYTSSICIDKKEVCDILPYQEDFQQRLQEVFTELYHPDIPFSQTEVPENCKYCDFKNICGKG